MTALTDELLNHLQGQPLADIAGKLGLSPSQASSAVSTALPLLLGTLGHNASQPQGAQALADTLQSNHAGQDLGSVLSSALGGGGQGSEILGHIFGSQQQNAAQGLGTATGLGNDQASALLKMLAPVVMAHLAQRFGQGNGNAAAGAPVAADQLGQALGQEHQQIAQQGGGVGDLLGAVLDHNGDGKTGVSDLLNLAGSFLGGRN